MGCHCLLQATFSIQRSNPGLLHCREKEIEDIIAENFPNIGKEAVTQVQEVQRVSGRINLKRNMLTFIVIKLKKKSKTKEKY